MISWDFPCDFPASQNGPADAAVHHARAARSAGGEQQFITLLDLGNAIRRGWENLEKLGFGGCFEL
jgi:hypothetical protein